MSACDCGGHDWGTHSHWCSAPWDNKKRPKGLDKVFAKPAETCKHVWTSGGDACQKCGLSLRAALWEKSLPLAYSCAHHARAAKPNGWRCTDCNHTEMCDHSWWPAAFPFMQCSKCHVVS